MARKVEDKTAEKPAAKRGVLSRRKTREDKKTDKKADKGLKSIPAPEAHELASLESSPVLPSAAGSLPSSGYNPQVPTTSGYAPYQPQATDFAGQYGGQFSSGISFGSDMGSYDGSSYSGGQISHNEIQRANDIAERISNIFKQKVIGQDRMRVALISSLIAGGHILIESVPGLAKTTAVRALCQAIGGSFSRIQCTPDLMPNDIVGTQIYNYSTGQFTTQLGPVHANLVLLDEINRSSAKTQSAMLEAMQEKQTTIGDQSYRLPEPFMVLATQNPIEEEGTYALPEAQMDRFLLKEIITYPTPEQEIQMVNAIISGAQEMTPVGLPVNLEDIAFLQQQCKRVHVSDAIKHYIVSIISTTRGGGPNPIVGLNRLVRVGASPRGTIAFIRICQALALLQGRAYVIPEDVKEMRYSVLRHRILRTFDAMADDMPVESIIDQVFQVVPVP